MFINERWENLNFPKCWLNDSRECTLIEHRKQAHNSIWWQFKWFYSQSTAFAQSWFRKRWLPQSNGSFHFWKIGTWKISNIPVIETNGQCPILLHASRRLSYRYSLKSDITEWLAKKQRDLSYRQGKELLLYKLVSLWKLKRKDIQSWQYTYCFSSHSSSTPTLHISYQCYWIDMGQN